MSSALLLPVAGCEESAGSSASLSRAGKGSKVTIVGVGQVGMACAYSILQQSLATELALVDAVEGKLAGELLDLQQGAAFLHSHVHITASTDYAVTEGSKLCIITAGARQMEGESRLDLIQRNVSIFRHIIPPLVKHSPDTILLVVSNPVDVLTYVAWKLSGLPLSRVLGSGTNLDSGRLRFLLGERLGLATSSVHAWIIGEHGDSSVPLWDSANVAGVPLAKLDSEPGEWEALHKQVVASAYEIIKLKGYTSWAIGLSVAQLTKSLLRNTGNVHAVTVNAKGQHGVEVPVFLSLPAVLGADGVRSIVQLSLSDKARAKFQESVQQLRKLQDELKL